MCLYDLLYICLAVLSIYRLELHLNVKFNITCTVLGFSGITQIMLFIIMSSTQSYISY